MRMMLHIALFAALALTASAQDNASSSLKEKVKKIEGEVSKITVVTDKGTTVFEGEDAKKLFQQIQRPKKVMVNVDTDFDMPDMPPPPPGKRMKHKVVVIDGDTIMNGSGDFLSFDKDSLLSKMKKFKFQFDDGEECGPMPRMYMFRGHGGHSKHGRCCVPPPCCREMCEDDDAQTEKEVVIIKKDKDGKRTVETFTGPDAEKKMQELEKEGKTGKAEKKVIIKKKDVKEKEAEKERNE